MYKKVVIITLAINNCQLNAGFGEWVARKILRVNVVSTPIDATTIADTLPVIDPTQYCGGVFSSNAVQVTSNVNVMLDRVAEVNPKKIEAASHAVSHGFMYGLASGIPTAIKDGVVYVKDTAVEHPVITTGIVATAMGTAVYYKFKPLTEEEQQLQQIEKDKRLAEIRKAASIARADEHADDYRRCLSRHAHDAGSCEDRIKRCHSPAGRLAAENRKMADEITESYRAYNR